MIPILSILPRKDPRAALTIVTPRMGSKQHGMHRRIPVSAVHLTDFIQIFLQRSTVEFSPCFIFENKYFLC
jgi:hypothetical protein